MIATPILSLMLMQASAVPPLMEDIRLPTTRSRPAGDTVAEPVPEGAARLAQCQALALSDPAAALLSASQWEGESAGAERSFARQCLGHAYVSQLRWEAASRAFLAARTDRPDAEPLARARLAAMAGNAALAEGRNDAALAAFDLADQDARAGGNRALAGEVSADRARALVALNRIDDAAAALATARADAPQLPSAWLLSATLARRQDQLAQAQYYIEKAASLAPSDAAVGLEGGLIAALSGRDEAARASWQSVVATSPDGPEAETARAYLAQLGESAPQP